ncbi:MAG TPA: MarR family transcriptional regulator [Candidatus Melainabacteria bacterium]|nr:MarR family transcriptional regulator [Candidatus Melainabacteria bacterium]HMP53945.1 MarR family transcriptional regulator [Candidatus Melainabacteria bacterium]
MDIPEEFANSPGFLLAQTTKILRKHVEEALKPLNLMPHEYGLLRILAVSGPMSQHSFQEQFGIDRTSVTAIVDSLERREYLYKDKSKKDKRVNMLYLKPKGKAAVTRATRRVQRVYREFLEPVSKEEWELAREVILKLLIAHRSHIHP